MTPETAILDQVPPNLEQKSAKFATLRPDLAPADYDAAVQAQVGDLLQKLLRKEIVSWIFLNHRDEFDLFRRYFCVMGLLTICLD